MSHRIVSEQTIERTDTNTSGTVGQTTLQKKSKRQSNTTSSGQSRFSKSQAEQQFDVDITSRTQLNELQRLERTHGKNVHDWLAEGMPREAMGTPRDMCAFRIRKGTPVPWNVETHNAQSVQRSTDTAANTGPAGETGVPESVRTVIGSTGHSLETSVQRLMEDRMG